MSMTSTDPIADMLTRIKNAIAVNKNSVVLPHSNAKESVAKLLKSANYIDDVKTSKAEVGKNLEIFINQSGTNARISFISRMSKPGRRHYVKAENIPTVKRGRGVVVISTSKGVMTGGDAKKKNIGGELICKVY